MQSFSKQELLQIERAVLTAEKKTSGEIVPVIFNAALPKQHKLIPAFFISFITRYLAREQFYKLKLTKTKGHTGILIAVFLKERRVEVVVDKGISKHYPQTTWDKLVGLIVTAAKQKKIIAGFCAAIKLCGEILHKYCPHQKNDVNELSDRVRIVIR